MLLKTVEFLIYMTKLKIPYEASIDVFLNPSSWPNAFLYDVSYALLRPLYTRVSIWRQSQDKLYAYMLSQARRLGGKDVLCQQLFKLAHLTKEYTYLTKLLVSPFSKDHDFTYLFNELDFFLQERFKHPDPWHGCSGKAEPLDRLTCSRDDYMLLVSDAANLLEKKHTHFINSLFMSDKTCIDVCLQNGFSIVKDMQIFIKGSHFIDKSILASEKKLYKISSRLVRWDTANVLIWSKKLWDEKDIFNYIKSVYNLQKIGNINTAQANGEDYFLSVLIDARFVRNLFNFTCWDISCQQLIIFT